MSTFTRRRFLANASRAAGVALPLLVPRSVLGTAEQPGANDRVHIGVIGMGARGKYLVGNVPAQGRVVAISDCYAPRMAKTLAPDRASVFGKVLQSFVENDAPSCATYGNYRRMLDDAKLDAVMIAMPDHHHALAAILACQAELDVYVEKPLSLTIAEGRAMVRAAERYRRIVQVGSQQRTMEFNRFACEFVRGGGLGKVKLVQVRNLPGPLRYDRVAGKSAPGDSRKFGIDLSEEPIPKGLAWDLFCGPAELRPHNRKLWVKDEFRVGGLLWRGWDLWRAFSGHLMTNWGGHSVDMVQYALGMDNTGPVEIWPEIGRLDASLSQDWLQKTPLLRASGDWRADAMRFCPVSMRYADGTELRLDPTVRQTVFHGERGKLLMSRNQFHTDPPDLITNGPDPKLKEKWSGPGHVARPHIENWLDCIRTRTAPNAPLEVGHRSATVCHLVNIARELGRRLRWDPQKETFLADEQANALLDRPRRGGWELPSIG